VNLGRVAWIAGWLVLLVVLQFTLRPLLAWRVQVDFLVIAVLMLAVRTRPGVAAFIGFAIGMATDALTPATFGAGALALGIVGFASSSLKAAFFTENQLLNGVFVFLGKWVFDVVYLLASRQMRASDLAVQLLWWSPLAAVVTAVAGLAVLAVSRPPDAGPRR
jgi:rod shape-determining protein MreD